MTEAAFGAALASGHDLAALDRALGQQPSNDVHDPGRDLEAFAGKANPDEGIEGRPFDPARFVEIGPRLVGQDHGLSVKALE